MEGGGDGGKDLTGGGLSGWIRITEGAKLSEKIRPSGLVKNRTRRGVWWSPQRPEMLSLCLNRRHID